MLLLKPRIQNYHWGKVGNESLVFQLSKSENEELPYAELWMGSYSNMPSFVLDGDKEIPLSDVIKSSPQTYLGSTLDKFGKEKLPFLFKVLSVRKALSIQCHPDPELAQKLFLEFPEIYKDPFAKPEMVIALTPFRALCNFCSKEETILHISNNKTLQSFFPSKLLEDLSNTSSIEEEGVARKGLIMFLFQNDNQMGTLIPELVSEIEQKTEKSERDKLVLTLNQDYPNDIGIVFSFFMNFVNLQIGESLVMNPNEPHAYLSGDCIECMKDSDNTIRCGLTPKFKDVKTLLEVSCLIKNLNYQANKVSYLISKIDEMESFVEDDYLPHHQEFRCIRLDLKTASREYFFEFPVIAICVHGNNVTICVEEEGKGTQTQKLEFGSVVYILPNKRFRFITEGKSTLFMCLNQ